MSHKLIDLSPDLKKLRDEGFEVEIRASYLLINSVPYLNSNKEIKLGALVSELTLAGDRTTTPKTHVVYFIGEHPCHKDGSLISQVGNSSKNQTLADGLVVNHSFSNKPHGGYVDYYEKMTTYNKIISSPAQSINDSVTANTFKVVESMDEESVFHYMDTNSSRADINLISDKLKTHKIGIIGLGGTGSYILDLVAKTPVQEIHLFDGDVFVQHNAFRAPGATSIEKLREAPKKTDYFQEIYSKMHRHIFSHSDYITSSNIDQLLGMDFVFICIDKGNIKELIVNKLEESEISFIDTGMGVEVVNDMLIGIIRVTTSTEEKRKHIREKERIPFSDGNGNDDYSKNIQIADLNALNASLAVIKWKKLCGFYNDFEKEHHSTYSLDVNMLLSEDNDS